MKLALFDLDGTLLPIDSDHAFGEFLVRLGWADGEEFRRGNDAFYAQYLEEALDIAAYVRFATAPWRARGAEEQAAASARFVAEVIAPAIDTRARALVARHADAGERLALVTATNEFVSRPIARLFGIDTLIATELQRDPQGRVTGEIHGVPAYREGKVQRVAQWLHQQGQRFEDFERISFYSDSTNDLALLEEVSHPVATNPAPALERIARERGWPILNLFA
ncbi:MAG TPA: HAD family hydrolase [Rubrivivax sp.]|nr:HAD family hydrolase [Rubrivivax sp.]HRZ59130.1 HAD family hydrolase [Rubrivivax sp.]